MPSLSGHSIRQICIFNVNSSTSPVINTLKVPNKLEESLRRIFDLLKLESNRRLAIKLVGEERFVVHKISKIKDGSVFYISSLKSITVHRFISLSNENFQSVLPFAKLWAKLDLHTPSSAIHDIHTNSFYSNVVNKYVVPGATVL